MVDRRNARVTAFQGMSKRFEGPLIEVALALATTEGGNLNGWLVFCLLYTSPSPRDS